MCEGGERNPPVGQTFEQSVHGFTSYKAKVRPSLAGPAGDYEGGGKDVGWFFWEYNQLVGSAAFGRGGA